MGRIPKSVESLFSLFSNRVDVINASARHLRQAFARTARSAHVERQCCFYSNLSASQLGRQLGEETTTGEQAVGHPDGYHQIGDTRQPDRQRLLAGRELLAL